MWLNRTQPPLLMFVLNKGWDIHPDAACVTLEETDICGPQSETGVDL